MDPEEIPYQTLRAIDETERQYPQKVAIDARIVEITGLDLRTIQDEMELLQNEGYANRFNTNDGYGATLNARGRRLLQELAARRAQAPRAREVQQQILEFLLCWEQTASGLAKNILVGGVGDRTIAEKLNLGVQIVRDNLDLLQQRGCVLLKLYVTGLYKRVANLTALGRTIAREPDYTPLKQPASGIHITYNQQGQQVTYQYNAAGDINIGAVQNKVELIDQLEKLKAEISKAEEAQVIDADTATEARVEIERAVNQAKKEQPDKKTLVERIEGGAKVLQAAATGAAAVPALIDALHNIAARIPHLPF